MSIDTCNPEAKTKLEAWYRWRNWFTARQVTNYGKKVVVRWI